MPASGPRTSSSSRCATANCSTGWSGSSELRWLQEPPAAPRRRRAAHRAWPAPELLAPLQQAVQLGYYRGILNQLDAIDAAQPEVRGLHGRHARAGAAVPVRGHRPRAGPGDPAEGVRRDEPMLDRSNSDVVLVVDDVPDNLSVLHDALDESGYTVLVATSGEAALQRAAQALPDIVLLDAMMPGWTASRWPSA
jgi:hypothetical protein